MLIFYKTEQGALKQNKVPQSRTGCRKKTEQGAAKQNRVSQSRTGCRKTEQGAAKQSRMSQIKKKLTDLQRYMMTF